VLVLKYNSRPPRMTGVAPMDLVTTRRLINFSKGRMRYGLTSEPA